MGFLKSKSRQSSQSESSSSSGNQAFPFLQQQFGSQTGLFNQANDQISNLLGLNGTPAQTQGFDNFRDSTGFDFRLQSGSNAITGNQAARGLLNSGATARELDRFGQDIGSAEFGNYISQLFNLGQQGLQAGNIISGSGGQSQATSTGTSQGSSSSGIGAGLGSLLSTGASLLRGGAG